MKITEQLQQLLNYPALQVIDANTGLPENEAEFDALSQSALITFLAGLYKATRTTEAAFLINSQETATDLLSAIFTKEEDITAKIASYTGQTADTVNSKLDEIATGFLSIDEYKSQDAATTTNDNLKTQLTSQRHEILKHLPANLKIGALLNDNTLGDNTNKMEGPVSSLMHKIENVFSSGD
jgi:hypothetical protein